MWGMTFFFNAIRYFSLWLLGWLSLPCYSTASAECPWPWWGMTFFLTLSLILPYGCKVDSLSHVVPFPLVAVLRYDNFTAVPYSFFWLLGWFSVPCCSTALLSAGLGLQGCVGGVLAVAGQSLCPWILRYLSALQGCWLNEITAVVRRDWFLCVHVYKAGVLDVVRASCHFEFLNAGLLCAFLKTVLVILKRCGVFTADLLVYMFERCFLFPLQVLCKPNVFYDVRPKNLCGFSF